MREIPLSQGQVALVDDADYDALMAYKWWAHWNPNSQTFYAERKESGTRRIIKMHGQLTGWARVDHIDHNGLNNQRSNLREVTRQQNGANSVSRIGSSRYKGVSWSSNTKKWKAEITIDGKRTYLGVHADEQEAARAYNHAAIAAWGEFAHLNITENQGDQDAQVDHAGGSSC